MFPLLSRDEYRHLKIDLRFPLEVEVLRMIERGDCDLGFVYEIRVSNYLQFHPVFVEELVLVASRELKLTIHDFRRLKTYEAMPMITHEEGHYVFGQWFETNFKKQPTSTLSAHYFEELEEVVEMVCLNRGLSILPDHAVAAAVKRGRLQVIKPFPKKKCTNTIFAVTRSGAALRSEITGIMKSLKGE